MNTLKRLAIAAVVVAFGFTGFGLVDTLLTDRSGDPSPAETEATVLGTASETLGQNDGTKPLPEIINFWRKRSEDHPLDYLSRTELGLALTTSAAQTADLETYAEAEGVFRDALRLNPKHHQARLGLASTLIASHDFVGAISHTTEVLNDKPGSLPALALSGDARLGIGDVERAGAVYRELLDGERSAPTVSRLARLRWAEGDPLGAVNSAAEALALSEELALRPKAQAFYHFQLGHFRFVSGQTDEAIDAYREALRLDKTHPGASEGLAFALASAGRFEQAAEQYEALLAIGQAADLHGHYAEVLLALGDETAAAEQFALGDRLASTTVDDNPAERRHIAGYLTARDPELAVALAETDLQERQDVGAYDTLAWALYHADRPEDAATAIASALATGSQDAALYYHAAAIAEENGDEKAALEYVTRALDLNPSFHPTEAEAAKALSARLAG